MSDEEDKHEKRAQAFVRKIEDELVKVVENPRAVFSARSNLIVELREILAESAMLARKAERKRLGEAFQKELGHSW